MTADGRTGGRAGGPRERIPVAVLGATGAVGQTFVRLLAGHPWFRLAEVAASERSAGKTYREATRWIEGAMPDDAAALTVVPCDPAHVKSPICFSALEAAVAGDVEPAFARAGRVVLSNTKNFRMDRDVPLVIPEVNVSHLEVLAAQRRARGWKDGGAIVTNANCATILATLALAPLHEQFRARRVFVATMQAVSGAGYPGVASLDILGNVIPFIGEEEPKVERELPKMLGRLTPGGGAIEPADIRVSAHTNRVAVEHGHTVCLSVEFDSKPSVDEAREVLRGWKGCAQAHGLPSSPERAVRLMDEPDRPQPRRDVMAGKGMTVSVGRVREDPLFHLKLVAMGHNTIRGAAGASLLNAEVMLASGLLGAATPPA